MQTETPDISSHEEISFRPRWWAHFSCRVWKLICFVGTTVVAGALASVLATWLTNPSGLISPDSPLRRLLALWPITLPVGGCLLFLSLWMREIGLRPTTYETVPH